MRKRPAEAWRVGIVHLEIRVGEDEGAPRDERLGELVRDLWQPVAADVVEELAADDQVEAARERVAGDVELQEADVREPLAASASAIGSDLGDVGGEEVVYVWSEPDGEVALGAADLERPPDARRDERECLLVLAPLVR